MHELDVFLQHQPLRKGPPGVWAVPVEKRQGDNLLAEKSLTWRDTLAAERPSLASSVLRGVKMMGTSQRSQAKWLFCYESQCPLCAKTIFAAFVKRFPSIFMSL